MSGHTPGDQLDLDEILRLAEGGFLLKDREVSRIAAEVRRLREDAQSMADEHYRFSDEAREWLLRAEAAEAERDRLREDLRRVHFKVGTHAMRAVGVEPPA